MSPSKNTETPPYNGGSQATILGLGMAVPGHVWQQKTFADYYFDITNSNSKADLKDKFKSICANTMIEKRHVCVSDELLRSNPCLTAYKAPSLNLRQELAQATVPQLGAEAAREAISDWGQPTSSITHLVFCTSVSGRMPGADFQVAKLLGLPPSTRRFMLYQTGCHGGGMALRLAKDVAENNPGARVLVVCSEVITMVLRGPSETHMGKFVGQAIFGDAAGAAIVGAGPMFRDTERPIFEMVWASQDIIPGTEEAVVAELGEDGIVFTLHRDVAMHISSNIKRLATAVLEKAGGDKKPDSNDEVFWVVHPGGREILDRVEEKLGLSREKLEVSREVMKQHGNTLSSCVIVAMAEMRRRSAERSLATAGEGLQWGLLFGFGPGLTVEAILLRALPMNLPI